MNSEYKGYNKTNILISVKNLRSKARRSRDQLKIIVRPTNARSIGNYKLDEFAIEDMKPDILGVTESWLINR